MAYYFSSPERKELSTQWKYLSGMKKSRDFQMEGTNRICDHQNYLTRIANRRYRNKKEMIKERIVEGTSGRNKGHDKQKYEYIQ